MAHSMFEGAIMRITALALAIFSGLPGAQAMAAAPAKPVPPPPVIQVAAPPPLVRTTPPTPIAKLPDPGPITPARRELANQLVQVTQPDGLMIESVLAGWQKGLETEKENFAALDKVSPGLGAELEKRGRAEMVAMVQESMPAMRASLTEIFATSATEDELRQMLAFYQSSAGQKLIRKVMLNTQGDVPEGGFTAEGLSKSNARVAMSTVGEMTTEETLTLIKLGRSPAGRRMQELGPRVQQASADWLNDLMARVPGRLGPIVDALINERLKGK